jgi:ankyrin repeat protein
LISQGADPTYALENAFGRDEVDAVQTLMNSGAEIDSSDVFRYATRNGHIHLVEQVLSKGFEINHENSYGLRYSTHYNLQSMSKFLIENGANANHHEILMNAVSNNDIFTARKSLEHGADVHLYSETPLVKACSNNNSGMVNVLIEHGADPNANDDEPLRIACKFGAQDSIKSLILENKMDANEKTREWLQCNGHGDTLKLLEKRDLNVKLQEKFSKPRPTIKKSNDFKMKI